MGFIKTAILVLICSITITKIPDLLQSREPLPRKGFAAPKWQKVLDTFNKLLDDGLEKGGQFAVYYKNQLVVDAVGGYADDEARIPMERDTLIQIFSTTKGVTGMVIAMLVDRGLLEYEEPIAKYWPEFAQNGKEKITVEQLMSHTAGLPVIDESFSIYDSLETQTKALEKQTPIWTPGTKHGYHTLSIGMYASELVRRVDPKKRDFSQFFAEEIAKPHGLDFYIGLPLEENHRCVRVYPASFFPDILTMPYLWKMMYSFTVDENSTFLRSLNRPVEAGQEGNMNQPKYRAYTNPASHGFSTAVNVARFFNMVLNGPKGKPPLVKRETVSRLTVPLASGEDATLGVPMTYGRGTTLFKSPLDTYPMGTPGAGGQMGYADPVHDLSWAYLTNHHTIHIGERNLVYGKLYRAMYDVVKDLES